MYSGATHSKSTMANHNAAKHSKSKCGEAKHTLKLMTKHLLFNASHSREKQHIAKHHTVKTVFAERSMAEQSVAK